MYKEFYNIKTDPFHTSPSPAIFYDSGVHQEAWEYLVQGITYREPFLLLTGDHGTGKTLLCLKLVQELQQKKILPHAYIPVATYSYTNILKEIAQNLNIEVNEHDESAIQYAIFQKLRALGKESGLYIVIDDVQDMELPALKRLRHLANFNYHGIFPIMFAFFAHTSFVEQLQSTDLIALDYRLKQRFHLSSLDIYETKEYIYFRLLKAEAPGIPVFTDEAVKEIFVFSNGIPQLINKICNACLILGASKQEKIIEASLVAEAKKTIAEESIEKISESKVTLAAEAQTTLSSYETYFKKVEDGGDEIKKVLNTIRNLTAVLIFSLIILLGALIVTNYFQYNLIVILKNVEVKSKTQTAPAKESHKVTNIKAPETTAPHNSSTAVVPGTVPKNVIPEEPSSPSKESNMVPAEPEQQNASMYPEQKENTISTIVSETTATTHLGKTAHYPYTIQLASYNSLEGARERIVLFKKIGLSPYLVRNVSRQTGELFWVICTGYYKTMGEAEQARKVHNLNEAMVMKTPYASLVGVYSAPEEMTGMIKRLEASEHFPYVIAGSDNVYRLYVGAYTTRQGAETLNRELNAAGIKNVIEER